jgi:hypothetical protein
MTNLPDEIQAAIHNALHHAQQDGNLFDVYEAAFEISEAFPDAQVSIENLVDSMVAHLGGIQAAEISPPALVIEIIVALDDEDEALSCRLIKEEPAQNGPRAPPHRSD